MPPPDVALTAEELERYEAQLALAGWGTAAQDELSKASAIVVGAGSLGAPAAAYLAAAGVGRLGIVDAAPVTLASLPRQALHFTPELEANKAESAALKLSVLNPEIQAEPYPVRLEAANAVAIVTGAAAVLDCSNDDHTGRLVNDACCAVGVPLVTAGHRGLAGFLMSVRPGGSACYRCASPRSARDAPEGRGSGGALGAVAGALGALQALEALKLLTGIGRPLVGRLLRLDGADMSQAISESVRQPGCPACAEAASEPQSS